MEDYSAGINQDIVSFIRPGSIVLDVGCADGLFGGFLKEKKNCIVFGVEKNRSSAKKAGKLLDKVFCLDIEKSRPRIKMGTIDVIVFADVLEHLRKPERTLGSFRPFIKPGGKIILSVPNIANIFVRKDLLLGKFNYSKQGILDENHLRFFTMKSIKRLLNENGFKIEQTRATRNALRNMFMQKAFCKMGLGTLYNKADYALANMWKRLFAQQVVIIAKTTT